MYIPLWFLVVALIVGVYYYSKSKKTNVGTNLFKQNFSYKLEITLEPNWNSLYKKLVNPKSEEEWKKLLDKKISKIDNSDDSGLWGRRYHFTEYYDSASGLTNRFQTTFTRNKNLFSTVDEFGDFGLIFESDRDLSQNSEDRGKLGVEINESSIRNNIYDKYVGGRSIPEKEDYLYNFPLHDVFSFLFTLGQRFHEAEENPIIKWPDHIEEKFKQLGIKYETYFDYEPTIFDIEKEDKEFFDKIGKPKVALFGDEKGYLTSDIAHYWIKLKIFRPNENDRIPTVLDSKMRT